MFYDYKYVGVWQYADSVAMKAFNANGSTFKAGDPRVADVNGRRQDRRQRPHDHRRQLSRLDRQHVATASRTTASICRRS